MAPKAVPVSKSAKSSDSEPKAGEIDTAVLDSVLIAAGEGLLHAVYANIARKEKAEKTKSSVEQMMSDAMKVIYPDNNATPPKVDSKFVAVASKKGKKDGVVTDIIVPKSMTAATKKTYSFMKMICEGSYFILGVLSEIDLPKVGFEEEEYNQRIDDLISEIKDLYEVSATEIYKPEVKTSTKGKGKGKKN